MHTWTAIKRRPLTLIVISKNKSAVGKELISYVKEIQRIRASTVTGRPELDIVMYSEINGEHRIFRHIYCSSDGNTAKFDLSHDDTNEMKEYETHLDPRDLLKIEKSEFEELWNAVEYRN